MTESIEIDQKESIGTDTQMVTTSTGSGTQANTPINYSENCFHTQDERREVFSQTLEDEKKAAFARRFIESCVFRYKIFMDTCSLLDPCAGMFWDTIVPFLIEYGKYIIIPKRCIEEVDKQITNKMDRDLSCRAQKVHAELFDLSMRHLVQVHGERTDGFADSVFLTVGAKFRTMYDMMLVTQDRTLAREFEALGDSQAVRTTHSIIARRINRFGFLSPFREQIMQSDEIADNEVGDDSSGQLELIEPVEAQNENAQ